MAGHIVTKTEYAAYRGVTPGAVSQWLTAGKIHGPALVGIGRTAKIDVTVADQQLAASLDLGQQFARGGQIGADRLTAVPVDPAPTLFAAADRRAEPPAPLAAPDGGLGETIGSDPGKRFNAAKAEIAELDLAERKEKALAKRGTYMLAAEARAMFGRDLAQLIRAVEQWLPDAAGTIASEMVRREGEARAAGQQAVPMSAREMSALLLREWRALRTRMKEQAEARRETAPALITVLLTLEEEAAEKD